MRVFQNKKPPAEKQEVKNKNKKYEKLEVEFLWGERSHIIEFRKII